MVEDEQVKLLFKSYLICIMKLSST